MITFGQKLRIKALIKKHGMTIRGLAKLSGVGKTVVGDINTGVIVKINEEQERGFCKAFNNCDRSYLYEDDGL